MRPTCRIIHSASFRHRPRKAGPRGTDSARSAAVVVGPAFRLNRSPTPWSGVRHASSGGQAHDIGAWPVALDTGVPEDVAFRSKSVPPRRQVRLPFPPKDQDFLVPFPEQNIAKQCRRPEARPPPRRPAFRYGVPAATHEMTDAVALRPRPVAPGAGTFGHPSAGPFRILHCFRLEDLRAADLAWILPESCDNRREQASTAGSHP